MSKRQAVGGHVLLGTLWLGLAGCSLDSDLPVRTGSAAPVNSAVILSGTSAGDVDASVSPGESARITDINGKSGSGSSRASANGMSEGIDSGGAFQERSLGVAGAVFNAGGAAGVGDDGESRDNGGVAGAPEKDPPPTLWFSEYIEGSSSNKALELTADARSVLDGCKVNTHFNGKAEATVVATLSGVLDAGQVLTLCTSTLKEKLADICNQSGNLTFNGDDVVTLSCQGTILDVIGEIGVDPGAAWGNDTNSTADHTLRRKCSVTSGDPLGSDPFDPSAEWQPFPVDTFDGLGVRGC